MPIHPSASEEVHRNLANNAAAARRKVEAFIAYAESR